MLLLIQWVIKMKKIVIFGGGSGLSQLLKGLQLFPLDITAVVSVADNGQSTGKLREEHNIPAVGDITKVLLSLAQINDDTRNLLNYRFSNSTSLGNHSLKNLLLTALIDLKGSIDESIPVLSELFDVKGTVLPLTNDSVHLVGHTKEGLEIIGEEEITLSSDKIVRLSYDKDFSVNPKIFLALEEADLIVFSSGSLCTSIIPHLIDNNLANKILKAKAKKMYVCNLFTQPGETDEFTVSQHIDYIEQYFSQPCVDVVIANDNLIQGELSKRYLTNEQKEFVVLDSDNLSTYDIEVIKSNLVVVEDQVFRHDSLKTSYLIFRYLMEHE